MTYPEDTSYHSPQPPLSSPNGLTNKVDVLGGMEVTHGLSNMGFSSPGLTWLQPLLGAVGTNTEPWYEPILQVDQQLPGGKTEVQKPGPGFQTAASWHPDL